MKIFTKDYVNITFDADVPCVILSWNGFAFPEEFKEAVINMLGFIEKNHKTYPCIQLLADSRNLGIVNRDVVTWMADEIDPELYKFGVRKVAFIVPENEFTQNSINQYKAKVIEQPGKLSPREFFDIDEAKKWLKEVN